MPRAEVGGIAAEPLGEGGVEARLPLVEGGRGRLVDFVECGEQSSAVELAGGEGESEVVAVAEAASRFVPESSELAHAVGDLVADLLRRFPCCSARRGVVARAQHVGDGVVVDALAVDLAAERVERRLDLDLELDDAAAKLGVDLVRGEGVVEHVELAGDERLELVRLRPGRLDRSEGIRVAQQLAPFQLDSFPTIGRLGRGVGVRLPPGLRQRGVERPEFGFEKGDEAVRVRHECEVYGRGRETLRAHADQQLVHARDRVGERLGGRGRDLPAEPRPVRIAERVAEVAAPEAGLVPGERLAMRHVPPVRARLEVDAPEPAALERAPKVGSVAEPCFPRDRGAHDVLGGVHVDEAPGDRRPDAGQLALLSVVDRLVVERTPRRDAEPPARAEGPDHVAEPGLVALEVRDDQARHDDVERLRRERQPGCSGSSQRDGRVGAGETEHRQRRIDPDDDTALGILGRGRGHDARAGADVEHRLVRFERDELQEVACDGLEARVPGAVVLAGDRVVRLPPGRTHGPVRISGAVSRLADAAA